jgi:hypothetical protein
MIDPGQTRRTALRALGTTGAALVGLVGSGRAAAKGTSRAADAAPAKKKKPCKCQLIGLTSAESDPFTLEANNGVTKQANCPAGFVSISGGLQGEAEVTAPCMIRESHPAPDGGAWIVNVFCTQATNTPLRVGVVCFSRSSFQLEASSSLLHWQPTR